jgi:ribose transport system substrate-binding protein
MTTHRVRPTLPMLLAAAMATIAAGCGSSSNTSSASNSSAAAGTSSGAAATSSSSAGSGGSLSGKQVSFIAGDKNDPFYVTLGCGALQAAKKYGLKLNMQAPTDFSASEQTPIVDGVAAQHPAAVMIAPTDANAMFAPIQQLAQSGSKVVFVDTTLNHPTMAAAQVSTDDYQAGVQAGQEMAKLTGGTGDVLIINLQAGVSTTDARGKGFIKGAEGAGLHVVDQEYSGNSPAKAASITEATLSRYPNLKGIFAATDFGAEGAVTALRAANKLGQVKIVGFDASPIMVSNLKQGNIQAIAAQQAQKIGVDGIDQVANALQGKPTTKSIALPTITVTKTNLNAPATKAVIQSLNCSA